MIFSSDEAIKCCELFNKILNLNTMPTKCIDLGYPNDSRSIKTIDFFYVLDESSLKILSSNFRPNVWENIELISRGITKGDLDIMFAYDKDRKSGNLYLGHWNDGVV